MPGGVGTRTLRGRQRLARIPVLGAPVLHSLAQQPLDSVATVKNDRASELDRIARRYETDPEFRRACFRETGRPHEADVVAASLRQSAERVRAMHAEILAARR